MSILAGLLYFVFVVSSILLIAIVLLQEGKGGGLAEAFGGVGAETFGVKSGGINKATATIAGIFLASAVAISLLAKNADTGLFSGGAGAGGGPGTASPTEAEGGATGGETGAAGGGEAGEAGAAGEAGGTSDAKKEE